MDWDDLSALALGLGVVVALLGAYGLGLLLRRIMPTGHKTHESLEIVHAVIGMLVAMAAILLGLQLDTGKKSFDQVAGMIDRQSIETVRLDQLLRDAGPQAEPARALLLAYAQDQLDNLRHDRIAEHPMAPTALRKLGEVLRGLTMGSPSETRLQAEALTLLGDIQRDHWWLLSAARLPADLPLYGVLLFWIVAVYLSFGLNAAFNGPAFLALCLSAVAVGAALFVLNDMDTPFGGLIKVSATPVAEAVQRLQE